MKNYVSESWAPEAQNRFALIEMEYFSVKGRLHGITGQLADAASLRTNRRLALESAEEAFSLEPNPETERRLEAAKASLDHAEAVVARLQSARKQISESLHPAGRILKQAATLLEKLGVETGHDL